ncbi:kinase [Dorcoceras hygrometricum]|uniref:Kinase n=1 Tax=Dorcoceras hygrometricum TaxID=472368 RepID=A0A2Z7CXN2_9LAMI|nr:kinase [Dorcoceras hygrometricum]
MRCRLHVCSTVLHAVRAPMRNVCTRGGGNLHDLLSQAAARKAACGVVAAARTAACGVVAAARLAPTNSTGNAGSIDVHQLLMKASIKPKNSSGRLGQARKNPRIQKSPPHFCPETATRAMRCRLHVCSTVLHAVRAPMRNVCTRGGGNLHDLLSQNAIQAEFGVLTDPSHGSDTTVGVAVDPDLAPGAQRKN